MRHRSPASALQGAKATRKGLAIIRTGAVKRPAQSGSSSHSSICIAAIVRFGR
jgi:hypothetical protein